MLSVEATNNSEKDILFNSGIFTIIKKADILIIMIEEKFLFIMNLQKKTT